MIPLLDKTLQRCIFLNRYFVCFSLYFGSLVEMEDTEQVPRVGVSNYVASNVATYVATYVAFSNVESSWQMSWQMTWQAS